MIRSLLRVVMTPQLLVSTLLLVSSLAFLLSGLRRDAPPSLIPKTSSPTSAERAVQEVRLVVIDGSGLERSALVPIDLPTADSLRLEGILSALRNAMIEVGVWPEVLTTPKAFVQRVDLLLVAVLDFEVESGLSLDVETEEILYRSISETVLSNGPEHLLILRDGRPAETFLGHVAIPSSLSSP
ncbi:MAG: hypothetical protein OXM87_00500 [Truepera sp.]|nr:hypothetical protein [Truepera sp.]